ncbi:MAG: hypothetical protein GWN01_14770 [Nitrosopumilaceae archaeon]|nr:hypothetical protein [Nitrosopumilaceae archaeon]NIU02113.1 hypothetical protein [Nitrosopumilaceae archaeon]NIU88505.1 hypothetical protein [Nitrosopumilaceae archaeon]NIV66747.1 hypothetical protein [Nitrosopumilaceae archaeon]NIX62714.1 hypothetical protein [Nitrosopumilaceae archaeon]
MIGDKWNRANRENLSQKIVDRVRPDVPLKSKIEFAQKKLQFQISKLDGITEKLQKKHELIFNKIVAAQKNNNTPYAQAYAIELAQVRKMRDMVSGAKLSMEQIQLRLNTVSELGDVVVTLSPCMSIIKGLSSSLSGIMPEANASMQDLSQVLGDVLSGSSINSNDVMTAPNQADSDSLAILEEAHAVIEGDVKTNIPEVPENLKQSTQQKKYDILG